MAHTGYGESQTPKAMNREMKMLRDILFLSMNGLGISKTRGGLR